MPTFPTTNPSEARAEWLNSPNGLPANLISPFDKGFLAQRKKEDEAKKKSLDLSETAPIGNAFRVSVGQPDEPKISGKTGTCSSIPDPNPNGSISQIGIVTYADNTAPSLANSPFPARRDRQAVKHGNAITTGLVTNQTVVAMPTTAGFGTNKLSGVSALAPASARSANDLGKSVIARPGASTSFIF